MTRGDWTILRTSGGKTLSLADSLALAGFDVWTPRELVERKRANSKEKTKIDAPILSGFLFVRADHLLELAAIRAMPVSPHPRFWFFNYGGGPARIRDAEIERVRKAHEKAERIRRREKRRDLVLGQRVRFDQGIVAGMDGEIVEIRRNGKAALCSFGGFEIEIEACDMPENLVSNDPTDLGAVA